MFPSWLEIPYAIETFDVFFYCFQISPVPCFFEEFAGVPDSWKLIINQSYICECVTELLWQKRWLFK